MLLESRIELGHHDRARLLVILLGHEDELVLAENFTE